MSGKSKRGFASMDPSRQRSIASKGGKAAHAKGTAHEWSSDEARDAGRKGGEVVSRDRAHMAAIGREGGEARGRARARLAGSFNRYDRETSVAFSRESAPNVPRREGERPAVPGDRLTPDL
jgi:general stress protein YciG